MSVFKNDDGRATMKAVESQLVETEKHIHAVEMAVTDRLRSLQKEINGLRSEQESIRKNMVTALGALSERLSLLEDKGA